MKLYTAMNIKNQVGYIDGLTTGIMATPALVPTVLTVTAFARNIHNCLAETQLSVAFASTNPFNYKDSSSFQIELP